MSHAVPVPVLTIDGPSGSGKGTISALVAEHLGWRLLDSGALYRAVGYAAGMAGLDLSDVDAVTRCAQTTKIHFRAASDGSQTRVIVNGHDATDELRTETAGAAASAIASMPSVREALVALQLGFRKAPGTGRRRARHGHGDLPGCRVQGVPHRERRRTREKTL